MSRSESEIRRLDALRPEDLERWIDPMKVLCRCPGYATCTECRASDRELLYCHLGRSEGCEMPARTCDRPVCKVTDELGLKNSFYCRNGAEKKLRERSRASLIRPALLFLLN